MWGGCGGGGHCGGGDDWEEVGIWGLSGLVVEWRWWVGYRGNPVNVRLSDTVELGVEEIAELMYAGCIMGRRLWETVSRCKELLML